MIRRSMVHGTPYSSIWVNEGDKANELPARAQDGQDGSHTPYAAPSPLAAVSMPFDVCASKFWQPLAVDAMGGHGRSRSVAHWRRG
jgi:hypothetical protein